MFGPEIDEFQGVDGIGYCGLNREPFVVATQAGKFALVFSGNIINREVLIERFRKEGHTFYREDNVEVLAKLIAQKNNIVTGLHHADTVIQGAFTALALTERGVFLVRSHEGQWPLVLGQKEGAIIVSSESNGFDNIGFKIFQNVGSGEIGFLSKGNYRPLLYPKEKKNSRICSFLWVYTGSPASVINGVPDDETRLKLGGFLAERDLVRGFVPEYVIPVPDSGRMHAIGYQQYFSRHKYDVEWVPLYHGPLTKYPYAGRSFIPPTSKAREMEAKIKIIASRGDSLRGKIVVVCDDSIVRGVQIKANLIPKLKGLGVKEVHFRISNPPLLSYCPWGNTTQRGEVLAEQFPDIEERIKHLEVDSLEYNTIDDLVRAIGTPKEHLCMDCDFNEK
jgi:amidophosphoribosyltransferase